MCLCSDSSPSGWWRWAAMGLLLVGLLASAGAQPAASRRATTSADNGLRQSHGHGHGHSRHSQRNADPARFLCGTELSDELARLCAGRGYNGRAMAYGARGPRFGGVFGGAATSCCNTGCTLKDLDSYCNPRPTTTPNPDSSMSTDSMSESESVESVSAATVYEEENTVPSNNEIQQDPVEQGNPRNQPNGAKAPKEEAENELPRQHPQPPHRVVKKTTDHYRPNTPVTHRQVSTIR